MSRQAAVVALSLLPFAFSTSLAYLAWEALGSMEALFKMVSIVFVWIAAFAGGTQLFWKIVGRLASRP